MSKFPGHWSDYAPETGWGWRYRHCLICNKVWRGGGYRPLIHKGRKAPKSINTKPHPHG